MINTKTPRMSETSPIDRFTHVGSTALIVAALDRRGRESLVCRRSYEMETLVGVSIHSEGIKTGSAASGTHELLMVSDPPASQGPSDQGAFQASKWPSAAVFFTLGAQGQCRGASTHAESYKGLCLRLPEPSGRPINGGRTDYEFVSPRTGFPGKGKGLKHAAEHGRYLL